MLIPVRRVCGWMAAGLVLSPAAILWGDQPQWGQAQTRNMVSAETGLPSTFDVASGRNVLWSVNIGTSSYSSPTVAKGKVFIGTNNGNPRDARHRGDRGILMCLDEKDGQLLWQLVVPKLPRDPYLDCPGVGLTGTAAIEEDRVYVVSNRGEVLCLDINGMSNGNDGPFQDEAAHAAPYGDDSIPVGKMDADILWAFDMRKEVNAYTHDSANVSVLILGPNLYVTTPNGVDRTHRHRPSPDAPGIIALDKKTGRLLAKDNTGIGARVFHSSFSSPSCGVINERSLVFYGGGDGMLYAFDEWKGGDKTGVLSLAWTFDADPTAPKTNISQYQGNRQESPSNIIGMPVLHRNRIYVTAGGDPWHGKRQAWIKCIDATGNGGSRAELWSFALQQHSISTPAVLDDLVFITDFGRMLHCLDAATGKELWSHEAEGPIWGSPMVADGKVFVASKRGDFWMFSASKEKQLLCKTTFPDEINSTPCVANKTLFVSTMSKLYAIGAKR